ncbi:PREDICTED: protein ROS1 isoform X2 [Tarenaya hassleriana]|nr:PREDICTED: protein ROS1 isoform X2 [Tarenaya hassleriana]XP_010521694.1 PREDICTED: protein ROS1 isoform X2 [Tarenaya hassleriana]XP_019056585.1 PREDICTED: protein ROS1 isoform X2 [Tarenaya hassleriana]XP_019056586.1 PREDICTED: protein ROS1 isoform X2 [Tarenaya hassleriana]
MEVPVPNCGFFVYKRRKKSSEFDKGGNEKEKESVLVPGTPVKLQIAKVYARRNSIKFKNRCPSMSLALEATTSRQKDSHASSAKEPKQEKDQSCNETGTSCVKVADDEGNVSVRFDIVSLSFEHHNRVDEKDKNACTDREAGDMVCFTNKESNNVLGNSSSGSPNSLGSSSASNIMFESQDIDGPALEHATYFKEEREVYISEKSSDKGLDEVCTFNKESVKELSPVMPKVDHFDISSSPVMNNDKQEIEENNFFPGDHGFVLLQKRAESEKNRSAKGPESSVTEDDHPRKKEEDSQGVGEKEGIKDSRTTPRKKVKKRSLRPRIMVDGKSSRKTAKVSVTKPVTLRKKTVSGKRKKNEAEVLVGPDTPGKQNSSKRRKLEKKSKHESIIEPVTPSSLESGMGAKKVAAFANVARALIFDQESQPGEDNLLTPLVHVDGHVNPNCNEIAKLSCAAEQVVILPDGDLVGDPNSASLRKVLENRLGGQRSEVSKQNLCLDSRKNLGPNFPELNKRRRTIRKPRADFLTLIFDISSAVQEAKSRNSNGKRNMSKSKRLLEFTWKKRSKRSVRVRNMSKWTEISLFNGLPKRGLALLGSRETKNSHAKGVPKITWLTQEVQNNKAKEPILLHDNGSQSLGFTALQNYGLVQNIGQASCCRIEPYPLGQHLERSFSQEHHQFVQDTLWLAKNGSSLEHEAAGNLYQNKCLLMCNGEVSPQNEDARALYKNQLPLRLYLNPAEVPLQFQETRFLYENFTRSFNFVPSMTYSGFLHCDGSKETEDMKLLIQKMRSLDINGRAMDLSVTVKANRKQVRKKGKVPNSERQLIVPNHAAQGSNMLVPYEEQVKQKVKGKVHLDLETVKEWQFLMMNDLPGGPNADEEREEKWETEREFFRGRVDLFIKRMHLLQADRKFKQWKGSVVDSVVGVFLTQNVSDNLSSNAYISLAATFPIEETEDTEFVDNSIGQFETVVNSEGLTYFIDVPPEENKDGSEVNDSVGEDQGSTHVSTMTRKDINTTLWEEINRGGCNAMLSCDENGIVEVEHETSKKHAESENQRSSFHKMNDDLKSSFTSISSYENENFLNMEEMERLIPVEGQGRKTPAVKEPQKATQKRNKKTGVMEDEKVDWKSIRRMYTKEGPRDRNQKDSADWDAVRVSDQGAVASAIKDRGQQNNIAGRIQDFLNKEVKENGTLDLEWLRDAPPDLVKRFLLGIDGLGLKSVECIRLLALKHIAFPVDTNVGRIAVRLGWVPLEPLPDEVQMHLLDEYPLMDSIQKYLWPRLCRLPQSTLYELHYQMITFGKVFCTKKSPNCNACPMKAECKHFASAYASSQLLLPGPQDKKTEDSDSFLVPATPHINANQTVQITSIEGNSSPEYRSQTNSSEPIVEVPPSPTPEIPELIDIEDTPCRASCQPNGEIPDIDVDMETFKKNVHDAILNIRKMLNSHNAEEVSKALVASTPENACIPMPAPRLKYYNRLRTEHVVYVLPDDHELLRGFERREPDDPSPYLLTVWQPGEKSHSFTPPKKKCNSDGSELCNDQTCFHCCNIQEENSKILRGTILVPCRTAMRGSFPLNGTYFQINEVFADQETSLKPLVFPREWTHGLEKRALYCGSSISSIFRGLDTRRIQLCFWTGYVCLRGFHREKRIPQELAGRLHTPPNKRGKKFERDDG